MSQDPTSGPAYPSEFLNSRMREDADFNATLLLGVIVGAIAGYHIGATQLAVDGAFAGLLVSAAIAAIIAEVSFALGGISQSGAWLLDRASPLITFGLLIAGAHHLW